MFRFVIRGVRGTMPACGTEYAQYGGNTSCFSIETREGLIIIDAGTGISNVTSELATRKYLPPITVLFTHFHMDHILGLPYFAPIYNKRAKITLMADPGRGACWKETLRTFVGNPFWPVGLSDTASVMDLQDLPDKSMQVCGVKISWFNVPHPQKCVAYRLEWNKTSVVVATDAEYAEDNIDPAFVDFCRNTEFLICDSQYTPEEYSTRHGWGHSTPGAAGRIALSAKVRNLLLTHHSPRRRDSEMADILGLATKVFPGAVLATENMVLQPTA